MSLDSKLSVFSFVVNKYVVVQIFFLYLGLDNELQKIRSSLFGSSDSASAECMLVFNIASEPFILREHQF